MEIKVGVLALQGGVAEHLNHLNKIENVRATAVKKPEDLNSCLSLIIPGGESTTMRKLIKAYKFKEAIIDFDRQQKVIWGSCAGLILMAAEVEGESENLIATAFHPELTDSLIFHKYFIDRVKHFKN